MARRQEDDYELDEEYEVEDEVAAAPRNSRWRLVVSIALLLGVGVAGRLIWNQVHSHLSGSSRYQLTGEVLYTLPETPPVWIRADVKAEVLEASNLTENLSLLDDPSVLHRRIIDAFEMHPWVRHVTRVEIASPKRVEVTLEYREPVAVAEIQSEAGMELLPVDVQATRLPDGDLSDVEKSYLPRIADVEGRPMVGEPWTDLRVLGAVRIAKRLREVWNDYHLHAIIPSPYPETEQSQRYYVYQIRTSGGTYIRWGAAPELGPPSENSFDDKLSRLSTYIAEHGPLDNINTPQAIDVRSQLYVEKRTVKNDQEEKLR